MNIKMNNLCNLHVVYQGKRNIFQEVEEFRKQEFQSRNFQAAREWLKETIELSNFAYKNKVTADLTMKTEKDAVKIKARTKHLECYVCEGEWQKENKREICIIPGNSI